ncbi:MAG TPA: glycosyltransferase family 1 protein [Iamia sp.]|nr:glycosyltransferase family 1 protein [Iamia sp.]
MTSTAAPARALLVAHRLAAADATGIGRYVRELATALAGPAGDAGWTIGLAATPEAEAPTWVPPGVGVTTLGGNRRRTHLAWTTVGRPRLERLGPPADVVHVLSPFTPIPTRTPLVWTVHDTWYLDRPEWGGRIDRWAGARALRQAAAGDGPVITPTAVTADAAVAVAGIDRDRIRVVPEGVAAEFHAAPADPADPARAEVLRRHGVVDGRYLLAVGGVGPRKHLDLLVEALRRLPPAPAADGPELLVVGPPGPGGDPVAEALAGLGARVRLGGFVPGADLPALMAGARAVVHPSRHEGFGLVPLEAMAAGAPVLAGEAPAVIEVTAGAACVLPDDPDAWAAAVTRLDADPAWRADLVATGRTHAAAFTWCRAAAATLAVYAEAVGR